MIGHWPAGGQSGVHEVLRCGLIAFVAARAVDHCRDEKSWESRVDRAAARSSHRQNDERSDPDSTQQLTETIDFHLRHRERREDVRGARPRSARGLVARGVLHHRDAGFVWLIAAGFKLPATGRPRAASIAPSRTPGSAAPAAELGSPDRSHCRRICTQRRSRTPHTISRLRVRR